jgi:hypothetical protein
MIFNKSAKLFLPMVLLSAAANGSMVLNVDGDSPGASTTFTNTVSGLSATFSSSADPGGFMVYPTTVGPPSWRNDARWWSPSNPSTSLESRWCARSTRGSA